MTAMSLHVAQISRVFCTARRLRYSVARLLCASCQQKRRL